MWWSFHLPSCLVSLEPFHSSPTSLRRSPDVSLDPGCAFERDLFSPSLVASCDLPPFFLKVHKMKRIPRSWSLRWDFRTVFLCGRAAFPDTFSLLRGLLHLKAMTLPLFSLSSKWHPISLFFLLVGGCCVCFLDRSREQFLHLTFLLAFSICGVS